jgi:hypothetical protein
MKRTVIIFAALLGTVASAHATPRTAHVSRCIAEQRAALAPLDQYGGHIPSIAPSVMQQIMNPIIDRMRVHCFPRSYTPSTYQWNVATGNYELQ